MRVVIIPKHTPRGTIVEVKSEHVSSDSVRTNIIGEALIETICDFLNFEKQRYAGVFILKLPKTQNVEDWIRNSQSRDSARESVDALQFVIDNLPHIRTKKDKQEISDRCRKALRRVNW